MWKAIITRVARMPSRTPRFAINFHQPPHLRVEDRNAHHPVSNRPAFTNDDSVASAAIQNGGRGFCVGRGSDVVFQTSETCRSPQRSLLLTSGARFPNFVEPFALSSRLIRTRKLVGKNARRNRPRAAVRIASSIRSHGQLSGWLKTGNTAPVISRIVFVR